MNKLTKKCVAAIASLAMAGTLCVAGAVTMAGVAWATKPQPPQPTISKEPWGSHVPQGPYSITIVNCDAKVDTSATGTTSQCDANHKPLDGAVFKLTPIKKIGDTELKADDFKKIDTWSKIATTIDALNRGKEDEAKIEVDDTQAKTATVNGGTAKFEQVPLGFYKVEETKMPTGNYGANDVTVFYMTLPQIERKPKTKDSTEIVTNYNYNPIVKIKNKDLSSSITKVFSTEKGSNAVSVKDAFDYVISAEVNHPAGTLDAKSIQDYMVFDDAPGDAFDNITEDTVKSVKMDGVDDALTKDTDYTVEIKQNSTTQAITDNDDSKNLAAQHTRILVKFKEDGLTKIAGALNKAQAGTEPKVHVTVSLKLSDSYKNDISKKEIKNKSGFFKSHPSNTTKDPDPIVSGDGDDDKGTSTVKLGFLQVYKHDKNDKNTKLPNAVFKIFNSEAKAEACKTALLKRSAGSTDVPTECSDGASTNFAGTTNDQGKFATDQKVIAGQMVYLVEVTAPTGYLLANEVRGVTVEEGKTTTVNFPNTKIADLKIDTWFNLPATGAAGVILFALAGMGLIAASVFLYMRNRKEEEQAKA
ncbi:SpaH/EbpB family LPXTG-anchored major pilin [Gardnerella vaginalis]|uniref:LPXTG-motif protein cell wall anchor domain protein n=1 Tax=Gardnerella vaginalis TaxID=2702 RepID=A0A133NPP5_GARVA|nr:SpaH/EbpB family LPXTG-anchored major pilin [Gardnerella vaginalis]KXA18280.1 LPXTG-motif protein cell wall anchor domain protein [Gardnerella vaginalis]